MNIEWVRWIILGAVVAAQILEIIRSERAHRAEIAAKDALIQNYESLSPPVLRDWLKASQEIGERQVELLKQQLEEKDLEIKALKSQGQARAEELERATKYRAEMLKTMNAMQNLLKEREIILKSFADWLSSHPVPSPTMQAMLTAHTPKEKADKQS
jgi:hypothetical protein